MGLTCGNAMVPPAGFEPATPALGVASAGTAGDVCFANSCVGVCHWLTHGSDVWSSAVPQTCHKRV